MKKWMENKHFAAVNTLALGGVMGVLLGMEPHARDASALAFYPAKAGGYRLLTPLLSLIVYLLSTLAVRGSNED